LCSGGKRRRSHVEFETIGHHDDCGVSVTVLVSGEFQSGGAIDEQAAAAVIGVLNDPLAATVSADKETIM
jgi:hypothetical protein